MIGTGNGERMAWWRDIAFYGAIPALGAWIGMDCQTDKQTLAAVVLALLVGMKAKMSNGKPGEAESQLVTIDNSKKQPVPVEDVGGKK